MNESTSVGAPPLLKSETEIIERSLVAINTTAIRPQYGDVLRHELKELPKLPFALPDLLFGLLALDGDTRKMGDLLYEIMLL
jgi:hypothetical protein